ncbi:MAG: hypothetical protein HRU36_01950 [Rickettsiales bacterium]|nr:hypothetical protein [Rickettsiales bacterium]
MKTKQKSFYEFIDSYISEFVPNNIDSLRSADLYRKMLFQFEKSLFCSTIKATKGNQSQAASVLGLSRATLRKKIKALKINPNAKS